MSGTRLMGIEGEGDPPAGGQLGKGGRVGLEQMGRIEGKREEHTDTSYRKMTEEAEQK